MTVHEKLVIIRELLAELREDNRELGASSTVIACHINTIRGIANQVLYKYYPEYFENHKDA